MVEHTNRNYIYHAYTKTICSKCGKLIDGKIVHNNKGVFISLTTLQTKVIRQGISKSLNSVSQKTAMTGI